MTRARSGVNVSRRRKRVRKHNRGYWGKRKNVWRQAVVAKMRAGAYAYRDRRQKKRVFRKLWILRISAACRDGGMRYSQFIAGLQRARVELDRKMLSELAIHDPDAFTQLVEIAKEHIPQPVPA